MAVATGTALLLSAAVGAGTAYYQGKKQEEMGDEAQQRIDLANEEAEKERLRIARESKPQELAAKGIKLGGDTTKLGDGFSEFITPASTTPTSTSGTSGLGFAV